MPRPHAAQFLAEGDQVIVVHPEQVVRLEQGLQGVREALADPDVALVVVAIEAGEVGAVVKERPQGAVREAVVVLLVVLVRQVRGRRGESAAIESLGRDAGAVGDLAAPAEPQPAGLLEGVEQRHREPPARVAFSVMATRLLTTTSRPSWSALMSASDGRLPGLAEAHGRSHDPHQRAGLKMDGWPVSASVPSGTTPVACGNRALPQCHLVLCVLGRVRASSSIYQTGIMLERAVPIDRGAICGRMVPRRTQGRNGYRPAQGNHVFTQPRSHRQLHLRCPRRRICAHRVVLPASIRCGPGVLQPDRR